MLGAAVFFTVSDGEAGSLTTIVDGVEVVGPVKLAGGVPTALAVLLSVPWSMSSCVTVYVVVQVTLAPGASEAAPAGQLIVPSVPEPLNVPSLTPTPPSVTLPVLVMRNEYVMVWPAAVAVAGDAVFFSVSAGLPVVVRVAVEGGDVSVVPDGSLPEAVAVLVTVPESTSAWVVV